MFCKKLDYVVFMVSLLLLLSVSGVSSSYSEDQFEMGQEMDEEGDLSLDSELQNSEYPFSDEYPSVQQLYDWYDDLVYEYPELVSKINIGNSWEGRDLWVLEITSEEDVQVNDKPEIFVDGGMHAREWSGPQVASYFTWRLVNEYDTNETVNWLLNNRRVFVMPMVNPDGYIYDGDGNYEERDSWRKNRNDSTPTTAVGVDLNRNWDIDWESGNDDPYAADYKGESPFSEYETKNMRDFILANDVDTYQNLHSYAGTMLIPWCNSTDPTPHDDWYRGMAEHMTSHTSIMGDDSQQYSYGQAEEEIGYSAPGGSGDWVYDEITAFSMVFEIETGGDGFYPTTDKIMTINEDLDDSLMYQSRIADTELGDSNENLYPPVPYIVYGTAEYNDGSAAAGVKVTIDNLDTGETISIDTDNNGYYELNFGNLVDNGYELDDTFEINAETFSEQFTIGSEWGQRIDIGLGEPGDPPEIQLNRPTGGEIWEAETEENIEWDTQQRDDPIDHVNLYYSVDGGNNFETIATEIADTGSYTWNIPNKDSEECHVKAEVVDEVGRTNDSTSDAFTIEGIPPSAPENLDIEHTGTDNVTVFEDDVESGDLGYTTGESTDTSTWDIRQHGASSGSYSWDFGDGDYNDPSNGGLSWLVSPEIDLTGVSNSTLTFQHWRDFEDASSLWDGANLKISTEGVGGPWTLVDNPSPSYDGTIETGYDNPLDGESGWGHEENTWEEVTVDLSGYDDETIWLNWSAGVDNYESTHQGWRIDDIYVTGEGSGNGTEDNLIKWQASKDDPDEVGHYTIYRSEEQTGPWDETTELDSVDADGSDMYEYSDENKGEVDDTYWWYVVRAVGENGLEEGNEDAVQEPGASLSTFDIDLTSGGDADGWNFVSFNLVPEDTSLTGILEDPDNGIAGNYDKVMYYDAGTDEWLSYMPERDDHFNGEIQWDETRGLWIRMTVDDTLTVEGNEPTSTDITLKPGWNMVSYSSSTATVEGTPAEVTIVGYFDAAQDNNVAYDYDPANFEFSPGEGYYIYNDADYDVTWTVDY
ncbi:MAG: M14 family zinc carboxypeptidase [Candidatus Saliniplasma sp.]